VKYHVLGETDQIFFNLKTKECISATFAMSLENEVRRDELLESAFEKHRSNINIDNAR
jgi:hypothetical protein